MSISTDYIVRAKYLVEGNAPEKLRGVEAGADRAGRSVDTLGGKLRAAMGLLAGGGAVAFGAKKFFIDFNDNLEQSQLRMAGLFNLNEGGTFNTNMTKAVDLVGRLQQRAKSSVGETSDFVSMAANILGPLTQAKAKMQEIEDVTAGATVAARSFGIQAEMAALDIEQALRGQLQSKDRFAKSLLEPMGFTAKSFNALSPEKRLSSLVQAFRQPALASLAKAQATSFAGQLSTLTDNLKMGLGKIGLPLFKEISAQLGKWNAWIDANPSRITAFAQSASKALVDGFNAVKEGLQWVERNKDTLLSLAKAAIVVKGASFVGAVAASPFNALNSFAGAMSGAGGAAKGFSGAMTSAAGRMTQLANIMGATYAAASLAADYVLRKQDREIAEQADVGADVNNAFTRGRGAGRALGPAGLHERVRQAMASGLLKVGAGGRLSVDQGKLAIGAGRRGDFEAAQKSMFGTSLYAKSIKELIAEMELLRMAQFDLRQSQMLVVQRGTWGLIAATMAEQTRKMTEDLIGYQRAGKKPPGNTNIGTLKVEVSAKDPERWISEALEAVGKKTARVPRRARGALRGEGV